MTRVNLDAIEEWAQMEPPESWGRRNVPAMVAELRAAREVVKAGRHHTSAVDECPELRAAIVAYDEAVGS